MNKNEKKCYKINMDELSFDRPDLNEAYKKFIQGRKLDFIPDDSEYLQLTKEEKINKIGKEKFFEEFYIKPLQEEYGFNIIKQYHTGVPDFLFRVDRNGKMAKILYDSGNIEKCMYAEKKPSVWAKSKNYIFASEDKGHISDWNHEENNGSEATHIVFGHYYNPKKHPKDINGNYLAVLFFEYDKKDKKQICIETPVNDVYLAIVEFVENLLKLGKIEPDGNIFYHTVEYFASLILPSFYTMGENSSKNTRTYIRTIWGLLEKAQIEEKDVVYEGVLGDQIPDILINEKVAQHQLKNESEKYRLRIRAEATEDAAFIFDKKECEKIINQYIKRFWDYRSYLIRHVLKQGVDNDEWIMVRNGEDKIGFPTIKLCCEPCYSMPQSVRMKIKQICDKHGLEISKEDEEENEDEE